MQKTFRKALSVLLTALLLLPMGATLLQANAAGLTPMIYFHGDETVFRRGEDGNSYALFDDGEYLQQIIDEALPLAAKAVISGDWSEYSAKILEIVGPAFEDFAPAPDGTLPADTGINDWEEQARWPSFYLQDGRPVYMFHSDFRMSPMDIADDAARYIETVKARTGASKVIVSGRCGGASLMAAYLYKYEKPTDYANVEGVVFINSSAQGTEYADALMSGNVKIPANGGYRFLRNLDSYSVIQENPLDEEIMSMIKTTVEMLHETYGINLTVELVNKIYEKVKDTLIAPIIKEYWGISGSYVASTVCDYYEDFKDYVFPTAEDKALYAPILAKMDDFHYNVQQNLRDDILAMKAAGASVNVFAEYGSQQYPLNEKTEYVGDYMLSVEDQSFGATVAKVDSTLDEAYIKAQEEKGLGKYISPDKQIDASTCLLQDNTWFIKNMIHEFPYQLDNLICEVLQNPANTVDSIEKYPQYLNYQKDDSLLRPLEAENENDMEWENPDPGSGTRGFIEIVRGLLEKLVAFIKGIINGIIGHAKGTVPPVE